VFTVAAPCEFDRKIRDFRPQQWPFRRFELGMSGGSLGDFDTRLRVVRGPNSGFHLILKMSPSVQIS
jgi:hypothetical protein